LLTPFRAIIRVSHQGIAELKALGINLEYSPVTDVAETDPVLWTERAHAMPGLFVSVSVSWDRDVCESVSSVN
jgi:hypothetical protein